MLLAALLPLSADAAAAPTTYDWWRDIWLPTALGAGSILTAAVAVWVAARSKRVAEDATKAAERSNEIAQRAIDQEALRADEQRAEAARQERRSLGDRFLARIDELSAEMQADPMLWSKPIDEIGDNALFRISPLVFEANIRGWQDFPSSKAVELVQSAAKAGGGVRRTQLGRNAAHTVINFWIEDPATIEAMVAFIEADTAKRMA